MVLLTYLRNTGGLREAVITVLYAGILRKGSAVKTVLLVNRVQVLTDLDSVFYADHTSAQKIVCTCAKVTSVVSDSATPWTVAHQAPLSMGFSRQEAWSGWPCPPPGDPPTPGVEPRSTFRHWQAGSLPLVPPEKPRVQ